MGKVKKDKKRDSSPHMEKVLLSGSSVFTGGVKEFKEESRWHRAFSPRKRKKTPKEELEDEGWCLVE